MIPVFPESAFHLFPPIEFLSRSSRYQLDGVQSDISVTNENILHLNF
jgi:hypothetical protein